jgi:hypothetical protein
MEKYAFKKGWKNLRYDDRKEVRFEIMEALHIKSIVSFHRRKRGIPSPRMDEGIKLTKISINTTSQIIKFGVAKTKAL